MKYASLCVLAYKRPNLLHRCLESIWHNTNFPTQLIVNLDANDEENSSYLFHQYRQGKISNLLLNAGKNRGVGRSFQNTLGVVEGDYIFKIDTDLVFKPNWLSTAVGILDKNHDIGAVSLFNYQHYDPKDTRFKVWNERPDCLVVNDFVSSIYGFRSSDLAKITPVADDGNHTKLGTLAITKEDLCTNHGFGVTKSTYVSGTEDHPYKTPVHDEPLVFR